MRLSKIIVDLRRSTGISQKELANKCELSQGRLSEYENDKRIPETENIVKLARALNCSTDYLLGLSDNPNVEGDSSRPTWDELFEGKEGESSDLVKLLNERIADLQGRIADKEQIIAEKDRRIADLEMLVEVYKEKAN